MNLGNILTPTIVQHIPQIEYEANPDELHTLLMIDPDARSFRHWVIFNIPGADVSKGDKIIEYVGAGPQKGSGLHRYVSLVYKQSGNISRDDATSVK